ncbi:hypothetical protein GCM10011519_28000 [Marmoricola endophyticus]|uniref:CBS domain-containing protein n=1 Tax=Marmoricola endophyticus TaxID=2040280 RepID=A0A917BP74_9ACTN|nr:CBS domain-containing protein [Marmoricola endophyticus]GGF52440.1 hypothetical protein GCM10011519_28000 [Marmoricola endophyticus]
MGTVDLGAYADRTVGQVMVRSPKVLAADATVGAAREALRDDHVHLVLLVDPDGRLVGTVVRDDLSGVTDAAPAIGAGTLRGRVVRPTSTVREVLPLLEGAVARRLAVVDGQGVLVGLLCLKRSRRGFCDDAGVAARAAERAETRLSPAR